jgi:hypothetical protein
VLARPDDRNQLRKQFISSHAFHRTTDERVRKITVKKQFESRNLESFDLVTQEVFRYLTVTIHNNPTIQTVEKIQSSEPESREKLNLASWRDYRTAAAVKSHLRHCDRTGRQGKLEPRRMETHTGP